MSRKYLRNDSRIKRLRMLAGLLAGLSIPALAAGQSVPFPTYTPGENLSGTQGPDYPSTLPHPWVVSDGTIITPAGTQVYLGTTTRAKALALDPKTSTHTAAVLQMGAPQAVTIFNTQTGAVLQNFAYSGSKTGSATGIAYTSDGLHLLFSQDSGYVAYVNVDPGTGIITSNVARISVPLDATTVNVPGFGPAGIRHCLRHHDSSQRLHSRSAGDTRPGDLYRHHRHLPLPAGLACHNHSRGNHSGFADRNLRLHQVIRLLHQLAHSLWHNSGDRTRGGRRHRGHRECTAPHSHGTLRPPRSHIAGHGRGDQRRYRDISRFQ